MIKGLNLSFSNKCPAKCVFCPKERGKRDNNYMKPRLVEKLVKELSEYNELKSVQIGENGEAFTNPYIIKNLRIIRKYFPDVHINLSSNLFCIKKKQIEIILKENLLNGLQTNIDGHDAESYEASKRIPYIRIMENLEMVLEQRKKYNPDFPFEINVLPLSVYSNNVEKLFGQKPLQAPEYIPSSSFEQVKESLREKNWFPDDVKINESRSFFWAERKIKIEIDYSRQQCPQLPRIKDEAFISPSGWWYPCCFDSNQDQVFGNVSKNSLADIYNSEKRLRFINMLENKQFTEIGYPCDYVPFCKGTK